MSGQGAMFTVANRCPQSVGVSAAGKGMNTLPPGGTVAAGATQGPSYIEAAFWGSSSFDLKIDDAITIPFELDGWAYYVMDGEDEVTQRRVLAAGKLVIVNIQQKGKGDQDIIRVEVIPLPATSAGVPGELLYRIA